MATPLNSSASALPAGTGGMRADIDTLLVQHKDAIAELRAAVVDCLPTTGRENTANFYDDIFLLRYVLSWETKGGLEESSKAVRETVTWRTEHSAVLAKTVATGRSPHKDIADRFQTSGYIGELGGVEPLFCVRTGYCNIVGLLNSLSVEQVTEMGTFDKEIAFQLCDKKTRETRTLVKMITIIDLAEFSLFGNGNDSRFYKTLGDSSKRAAVVYPQLLGKTVLINPPSFLKVLFSAFSVFMPQSALDKVAICPATDTFDPAADKVNTCPFVNRWCGKAGALAEVPPFLGGTAECPALLRPREECLDKAMKKVEIENRSAVTVDLEVPTGGCTVVWELLVGEYGLDFSGTLQPSSKDAKPLTVLEVMKIEDKPALLRGEFVVPEAGVVHLKFDNSDSFFRSKTFEYSLVVRDEAATAAAKEEAGNVADLLGKLTM